MNAAEHRAERFSRRAWLAIAAGAFAVVAVGGIFWLEYAAFGPRATGQSWLFWAAAIPVYLLLQFFAEVVLQGFWGASSIVAKALPVVVVVLFYAAYFALIA
jgi:hypothetical protein